MKKYLFVLLGVFFLNLPIYAQTFQEYLANFPLINTNTTWTDAQIAEFPASTKPTLDKKFYPFVRDQVTAKAIYPLGRIESGACAIVFYVEPSSAYLANDNTQIAINAISYNKKSGKVLGAGYNFYLFSVGGDMVTNRFMYTGKVETDGKTWLKVYQTGTGSALQKQQAYKISGKGLQFDKEF